MQDLGRRDPAYVTAAGEPLERLPHGVSCHRVPTQVVARGSVCEMFDPRWGWNADPLVFCYMCTIRPGVVKGWGLHKEHADRYFIQFGELEVVLYDVRPDSPTNGLLSRVVLSQFDRRLINIPAGIWHADHNIGTTDAVFVNFPTQPYDHANPDKYRLPINTDEIPHRFENASGW